MAPGTRTGVLAVDKVSRRAMDSPYTPPRSAGSPHEDGTASSDRSARKYHVAVILSGIFGVLGIQHFYLGRFGMGVLDLSLSIAAFGFFAAGEVLVGAAFFAADLVHTLVVTIMLFTGSFRDGDGKLVCYPGQVLPGERRADS